MEVVIFICRKCQEGCLSKEGKDWPWLESPGPCEICKEMDVCKDVFSGAYWAWKKEEV